MTVTLSITFLVLFILAAIYCKTTNKVQREKYMMRLSHLSSLTNITVYCIWIAGFLLMVMEVLLICDVYNVTSFPWFWFEASLIVVVIILLFTLGLIKKNISNDKGNVKKHFRIIVKALFLQMIFVSLTSILFAIKLFL